MAPENNDRYKMLLGTDGQRLGADGSQRPQHFFIPAPTYSDLVEIGLQQIKKMAGNAKPRIAFVHSNIEFGRDPVPQRLERIKALGWELRHRGRDRDDRRRRHRERGKLRQAKPDFILFHGYAGNVARRAQAARDYNIKAQAMGMIWGVDPDTVKGIGEAADGFIGIVPPRCRSKATTTPTIKAVDAGAHQARRSNISGLWRHRLHERLGSPS